MKEIVEFEVAGVGGAGGRVFLNSMSAFRDADCFTDVLSFSQTPVLASIGIEHFDDLLGRRIRAQGTIEDFQGRLEMVIHDIATQLEVLTPEEKWVRASAREALRDEQLDPPIERLRASIGQSQTVQFRVQIVGGYDRRYLNSMADFRSPDCFTAVIEPGQVASLASLGLDDPVKDLPGKIVRVTGKIDEQDGQVRMRITDFAKQFELLKVP